MGFSQYLHYKYNSQQHYSCFSNRLVMKTFFLISELVQCYVKDHIWKSNLGGQLQKKKFSNICCSFIRAKKGEEKKERLDYYNNDHF